nr:unnamed protein product [Callosobruchus analis]
MNPKQHHRL